MTYIQRKGQGYLETVAEYESYTQAVKDLREYQWSDGSAIYYLSTRPCKGWK
jgi:hypothetical protein